MYRISRAEFFTLSDILFTQYPALEGPHICYPVMAGYPAGRTKTSEELEGLKNSCFPRPLLSFQVLKALFKVNIVKKGLRGIGPLQKR